MHNDYNIIGQFNMKILLSGAELERLEIKIGLFKYTKKKTNPMTKQLRKKQ